MRIKIIIRAEKYTKQQTVNTNKAQYPNKIKQSTYIPLQRCSLSIISLLEILDKIFSTNNSCCKISYPLSQPSIFLLRDDTLNLLLLSWKKMRSNSNLNKTRLHCWLRGYSLNFYAIVKLRIKNYQENSTECFIKVSFVLFSQANRAPETILYAFILFNL